MKDDFGNLLDFLAQLKKLKVKIEYCMMYMCVYVQCMYNVCTFECVTPAILCLVDTYVNVKIYFYTYIDAQFVHDINMFVYVYICVDCSIHRGCIHTVINGRCNL